MPKKSLVLSLFFAIFFFFNFSSYISARSGCCSGHDGVNCGAGSQGNGKVICNDGWRGSSCLYSEMAMCGGSNTQKTPIIVAPTRYIPPNTPKPTYVPRPTAIPTQKKYPTSMPKKVNPTQKTIPTNKIISCSATKDNECPSKCGMGNDIDCCNNNPEYHWITNAGCYPKKLNCSATPDGKCDWYCSAGNDADCCEQKLTDHAWFENLGCYPKQINQCLGVADGICPKFCDNGWDADCCEQNLSSHRWYENWGCYER